MKQLSAAATIMFCVLLAFFMHVARTFAQTAETPLDLKLLGTRSWIRLEWNDNAPGEKGYHIYWSAKNKKPAKPQAVADANTTRYYIQDVQPEQKYFVWVEWKKAHGKNNTAYGEAVTTKQWTLDPDEAGQLDIPAQPLYQKA